MARLRSECERIASACTACGDCVRACPMLAYAPETASADPGDVVRGVIDLLRGGPSTPPALAWIAACTRSAICTDVCREEAIDPAYMMRLAKMRAMGALNETPSIAVKEDAQFSPRVKAFARLTLTPDEQEKWL
jgi:NAD-dependent dihydropyrimidine dehydrogenase PreA subunit